MKVQSLKRKFTIQFLFFCVIVPIILVGSVAGFLLFFANGQKVKVEDNKKLILENIYHYEGKQLKSMANYYARAILTSLPPESHNLTETSPWLLRSYLLENMPLKWSKYIILIIDKNGKLLASALNPNHYDDMLPKSIFSPAYLGETFVAVDRFPSNFIEQENVQDELIFYACSPIFHNQNQLIDAFVVVGYPLMPQNKLYEKIAESLGSQSIRDIKPVTKSSQIENLSDFTLKNSQGQPVLSLPIFVGNSIFAKVEGKMILWTAIAGVVILVFSVLFALLGIWWVIHPIDNLQRFMIRIEQGDYSGNIESKGNDPLSVVFHQFNVLKNDIQQLVDKEQAYSAKLDKLNEIRKEITSILELEKLIQNIVTQVVNMVACEKCTLWIHDSERKILTCRASHNLPLTEKKKIVHYGKGIVGTAAKKQRQIYIKNVREQIKGDNVPDEYIGIGSLISIPMISRGEVYGVLNIAKTDIDAFGREESEMLSVLAGQAGVAIENAIVYGEASERERFKEEMEIATDIQNKLLPKRVPQIKSIELHGRMIPAKEVGGDYYDFIETKSGEEVRMIIGDVSGKGVSAGLIMMRARTVLHSLAPFISSPKQNLVNLNSLIEPEIGVGKFMTMLYLKWDGLSRTLYYSSAGHEHILVYRGKTRVCDKIKSGGLAIGLIGDVSPILKEDSIHLEPGDAVVLYTDGVTEARSDWGDLYGLDRLQNAVSKYGERGASEMQQAILMELYSFIGSAEQYDDITLLTMKVK